jgi:hypothetical protein
MVVGEGETASWAAQHNTAPAPRACDVQLYLPAVAVQLAHPSDLDSYARDLERVPDARVYHNLPRVA